MNLQALPFYRLQNQQLRYSRCAAYDTQILSPSDRFLPFVVRRPATGQGLDCVLVYNATTNALIRTIQPQNFPHQVLTDGVSDYYVYFGNLLPGLNLPCGEYYLDVKEYKSEVFQVVASLDGLLKLEWSHTSDVDRLPYSQGWQQRLYVRGIVGEPRYNYTEEGEENGNGDFVAAARKTVKTWRLDTDAMPEFLTDALIGMALHDTVNIASREGVKGLKVAVTTWTKDGCGGITSLDFGEAPIQSGSCDEVSVLEPAEVFGYIPKPWLCGGVASSAPFWENGTETRCITTDQVFESAPISEQVTRDNCPQGYTPGTVTYRLPLGHVLNTESQEEADALARLYFDETKQAYANNTANCLAADAAGNSGGAISVSAGLNQDDPQETLWTIQRETATVDVSVVVLFRYVNNTQQARTFTLAIGEDTKSGSFFRVSTAEILDATIQSTNPNIYTF